jgi:hypothetical protein
MGDLTPCSLSPSPLAGEGLGRGGEGEQEPPWVMGKLFFSPCGPPTR